MNRVILMGRLTRDPEVRYTTGDNQMAIARYTLAVDRRFTRGGNNDGNNADFIPCVVFGKSAEFTERYLKKGTKIAVTGRIQTGSYTNRDGVKVYTTEVIVEDQEFAESRNASQQGGGSSTGGDTPAQLFSISSATVNNESITVGSAKQVMCAEGETTEDLDIRITFSNVGSATAIQLFKNGTQVGNDHAISGNSASFVQSAAEIGSYVIKVKKSDNSVATPGYTIYVAAYQSNPGGGMDQN